MKLTDADIDLVTNCAALHGVSATAVAAYIVWAETPASQREMVRTTYEWMVGQMGGEAKWDVFKWEVWNAFIIRSEMAAGS